MRVGIGYDVHKLSVKRRLVLGGVDIPHAKGLLGHSDADVLVHAIMDAILGAAAMGDIGMHFPDSDQSFKDSDSLMLLDRVMQKVRNAGYSIVNVDSVIMAEKPKIAPFIQQMRTNLAKRFQCDPNQVSIKATTTESLGFVGREEGIAAQAVVLIDKIDK